MLSPNNEIPKGKNGNVKKREREKRRRDREEGTGEKGKKTRKHINIDSVAMKIHSSVLTAKPLLSSKFEI